MITVTKTNSGVAYYVLVNGQYLYIQNDTVKFTSNGVAWFASYVSVTNPSAIYTGATGTLSAGNNLVTYGTKVKDNLNAYSGGVYTILVPGTYYISAMFSISGTRVLNTYDQIIIQVDGATNIAAPYYYSGGAISGLVLQTGISYSFTVGQNVKIMSYTAATGPSFEAIASRNVFSITRTGN